MNNLTKDLILQTLEEHKQELRGFGVKKMELFGSYARDEQRQDSDIDFLVDFEPDRGLFDDYSGLLILLEDILGKPIELVKSRLVREELKPYIFNGVRHEARI